MPRAAAPLRIGDDRPTGHGRTAVQPPATSGAALAYAEVTPRQMAARNALYRRRPPLQLTLAGEAVTLAPTWPLPDLPAAGYCSLAFSLDGGASAELTLPRRYVLRWLQAVDPETALERLKPDQAALLVECALVEEIAWLESNSGWAISIESVAAARSGRPDESCFAFTLDDGNGETDTCVLRLPVEPAHQLAALLDRPASTVPLPDLPFPVSVLVAVADLSVGELRDLRLGDVVLAEETRTAEAAGLAAFAGHLVAPVVLTGEGACLEAAPRPIRGSDWEWMMNDRSRAADAAGPDDTDLESLPVKLVFEVGRAELPLGELRNLGPGGLVPLSRTTDEAVDLIANGRRIGRGELVRIGEALGVRVTRLFDNA